MGHADSERQPLDRADELRLIEFLALVAGLLGIVVTISPSTLELDRIPLSTIFVASLVGFMFYSAFAYIGTLRRNMADSSDYTKAAIAYFSVLMAYALATNLTTTALQVGGPLNLEYPFFVSGFGFFWFLFYFLILRAYKAKPDES